MHNVMLSFLLATTATFTQSSPTVLTSTDGRIGVAFTTDENQLVCEVSFQGKPLVERSALRLELQGRPPLGSNVRIANTFRSSIDETHRLVTGKTSTGRNHSNVLRLELTETGRLPRKLVIEARAYDDAVAFR